MPRIRTLVAVATLGLVLAACDSGAVQGETGAPSLAPVSPAASPAGSPAGSPAASPSAASPAASPSASGGSGIGSPPPVATPAGSPGEVTEVPFEPAGQPDLGGTVTLTEYGSTTQVEVEFDSFELPATGAVAEMRTGDCETTDVQSAGRLAVTEGRLEGNIAIPANLILDLPHNIVVLENETATEPLVCIDLVRPES